MKSFNFLSLGLISIALFSPLNQTVNASTPSLPDSVKNNTKCRDALTKARNILENVDNAELSETRLFEHGYEKYPPNRPFGYIFVVWGAGGDDILASPEFLTIISRDIIKNCSSIGLVKFGKNYTDLAPRTYGLMDNGEVEEFEPYFDCSIYEEDNYEEDTYEVKWGYYDPFCVG